MTPDALPRDYDALTARLRAAATPPVSLRIVGQQTSAGGAGRDDLLLLRVPAAGIPRWRVYLNGGTHGDEPAGRHPGQSSVRRVHASRSALFDLRARRVGPKGRRLGNQLVRQVQLGAR